MAIALRNRWRRRRLLPEELRDEVTPKNILMIGPTGVGKTEIARRLAKLAQAPFIKIEATKFTEVGYVGRDVDSIIRDLIATALTMPLILLGGITRKETMDLAMVEGFAFVALARALLREPDLIRRMQADPGVRSLCIHCNKCMPTIYRGTHCVLADAGRT